MIKKIFKNRTTRQPLIFLGAFLMFGFMLALIPQQNASALQYNFQNVTLRWVDKATILADGVTQDATFTDSNPNDSTREFVFIDGCGANKIKITSGDNVATVTYSFVDTGNPNKLIDPTPPGGNCVTLSQDSQEVKDTQNASKAPPATGTPPVSNPQNIENPYKGTTFAWRDAGAITTDGPITSTFESTDDGKTFTSTTPHGDGETCFDQILNVSADKKSASVKIFQKQLVAGGEQCVEKATFAVVLGSVDNQKKPAVVKDASLENEAACDNALSPFGWVLCPVMGLANNLYDGFVTLINDLLFFNSEKFNSGGLEKTSHLFVNLANVAIVLFALVMIAAQIFSFEVFSAYTVKKVLPRIVIGAILIQLSWPIFTLFIQFVNAIGSGLYWMLLAPFGLASSEGFVKINEIVAQGAANSGGEAANAAGTAVTLAGAAIGVGFLAISGAWLTIVVGAIGIVISLIVALLTLILREVILIVLLAIAPLALALWIFPGTNKYWDLWWKSFNKLLLMYPLIMLLLAGGAMAASILSAPGNDDIYKFFAIIAYFAPIFLIGATYKFAGDAFGAINGATSKLGNKAKGAGYFGLRDRAKLNKENSAWALSRKSKDSDVVRNAQQRQAKTLTGTNAYSGFMRRRSGISADGRTRAVANAGAAIMNEEEQKFKDEAAQTRFMVRELAKANTDSSLTQYQKEEKVRSQMISQGLDAGIKGNDTTTQTINGQRYNLNRSMMANATIEALNLKDGHEEEVGTGRYGADGKEIKVTQDSGMTRYLATQQGFEDLANLGTSSSAAMEVLGKRLPTTVKGNQIIVNGDKEYAAASLAGITTEGKFAKGFDDALEGYGSLGKGQQAEVRVALSNALELRPEDVTARLATLARGDLKPDQLDAISEQFKAQGLKMAELRNNPNGVLSYENGQFIISTGGGTPPPAGPSGPGPSASGTPDNPNNGYM